MKMNPTLTYLAMFATVLVKLLKGIVVTIAFDELEGNRGQTRNYELASDLGRGTMGSVNEAYVVEKRAKGDWKKGRKVAVKVIPAERATAQTEYTASRILHDCTQTPVQGLVYVHGFGTVHIENFYINGSAVIVMDIVEGISLLSYLKKHDLLSYADGDSRDSNMREKFQIAVELMVNMLPIYEFVHGKGIVHNDLSMGNVMLKETEGGIPKEFTLIDFGIASLPGEAVKPEVDMHSLVSLVCGISRVCVVSNDDRNPTITKTEVYHEHGAAMFDAVRDMFRDVVKLEGENQAFDYGKNLRKFSEMPGRVKQEANSNPSTMGEFIHNTLLCKGGRSTKK